MNKKAILLTFSFNYNYGGVLQAYATKMALKKLGVDAHFPAYVPNYVKGNSSFYRGLGIRNGGNPIQAVYKRVLQFNRYRKFDLFRAEHMPSEAKLKNIYDLSAAVEGYDYVITGSDQAWNSNWYSDFEGYFFQDFVSDHNDVSKISYASCFGSETQPQEYRGRIGKLLSQYDNIAVRNEMSANIVDDLIGIKPKIVVDPTLLHDFNELKDKTWDTELDIILVYALDEDNLSVGRKISERLKQMSGCKIVFINGERSHRISWADELLDDKGPKEWVELFYRAKYIVTDSFHGCVFATKFEKKFIPYTIGWRAGRIHSFSKLAGIDKILIDGNSVPYIDDSYWDVLDFASVKEALNKAKSQSLDYLSSVLVK